LPLEENPISGFLDNRQPQRRTSARNVVSELFKHCARRDLAGQVLARDQLGPVLNGLAAQDIFPDGLLAVGRLISQLPRASIECEAPTLRYLTRRRRVECGTASKNCSRADHHKNRSD